MVDTHYRYSKHLLELEAGSLVRKEALPDYTCRVVTQLQLGEALSDYPDQEFAAYILRGIENGFRIRLNPQLVTLQSAKKKYVLSSGADRGSQ